MRASVTETVKVGATPTNETRTVSYGYDNLNRLTDETAAAASGGYDIDYAYDLVGNRLRRDVTIGGLVLTTAYDYYDGTDKLETEVHTGPTTCMYIGNERYYAYAGAGGGGLYYLDEKGAKVGSMGAFLRGLPSSVGQWLFRILAALIPIALFAPVFARIENPKKRRRFFGVVYRQGMCVLLAYLMLFTPGMFEELARADIAYGDLCTVDWGSGGETVHYQYDANGSVTQKLTAYTGETNPDTNYIEKLVYVYNLQNRLWRVETYDDTHALVNAVEYKYDADGIRTQKAESWAYYEQVIQFPPGMCSVRTVRSRGGRSRRGAMRLIRVLRKCLLAIIRSL